MKPFFGARRLGGIASVAWLALSGCTVGPNYTRPTLPGVEAYTETPPPAVVEAGSGTPQQRLLTGTDLPAAWWTLFKSPQLDELVRAGLANNPTVAGAQAALRVAQENLRAQQGVAYPQVAVGYAGSRQRIPDPLASPASTNSSVYSLHTAQLTVAYLPDVFGGNGRAVESLRAQADAQHWEAEATYLTLTSNLVGAAIQEASLRAQADATVRLIEIQRDVLGRYRRLESLGEVSNADVAQQEAALAAAEANLPPLDRQIVLQRDLIKALAGRMPADREVPAFTLDKLTLPADVPLTLPSTLVAHRPDVLAAEAQLRAASADVGVAAANRLPSISLGVDAWGSTAFSLGNLFKAGTGFWTLAGGITQPIFDAGTLKHREGAARAAYDQAEAQYRSTVINAFQGVADALQAIEVDARGLRVALHAREAAERSLDMARRQLALGDLSPMAALQAEQGALQASIGVAQAQAGRLADTAALFQALGGGWWQRDPSDPLAVAIPSSTP